MFKNILKFRFSYDITLKRVMKPCFLETASKTDSGTLDNLLHKAGKKARKNDEGMKVIIMIHGIGQSL